MTELAKAATKRAAADASKAQVASAGSMLGAEVCLLENVQCIAPRGRFGVRVGTGGVSFEGKTQCSAAFAEVDCVVQFPKPDLYGNKKVDTEFLLIALKTPAVHGKQKLESFVVQMATKNSLDLSLDSAALPASCLTALTAGLGEHLGDGGAVSGPEPTVLPQVLACMGSQPIGKPSPMVFSNASGGAHVACYRKVQEGFLYPLAEGLLFFKPPMLLKLHEIASMSTTAGGARFLELSVEMEDGTKHEFSNIDKGEVNGLQGYAQYVAKAHKTRAKAEAAAAASGAAEGSGSGSAGVGTAALVEEIMDDSEEEDEDFDPDASDSDEDGSGSDESDEDGESGSGSESGEEESDYEEEENPACDDSEADNDGTESEEEEKPGARKKRKRAAAVAAAPKTATALQAVVATKTNAAGGLGEVSPGKKLKTAPMFAAKAAAKKSATVDMTAAGEENQEVLDVSSP